MKVSRVFTNGIIIFLGIGILFLIMDFLNLTHLYYLRVLNVFIVIYGVNRTIKMNQADGVRGYLTNFIAAVTTSMIGAILSVASLLAYIEYRGGEAYLKIISKGFLFGGGELSIYQYCIGLLFESVAASMIISFCLMQYWKDKVEVINKVN